MSIFQYLLIEGKKDVMVDKMGMTPTLADHFIKYFNKKFVLYWATAYMDSVNLKGSRMASEDLSFDVFKGSNIIQQFKQLEELIRDPQLPNLDKEYLNTFKQKGSDDHLIRLQDYIEKYVSIRDYAERTNQNFQNDDFMEIAQESKEWHDNLKVTGNTIELEGDMEVIHEFDDGYYWVDNHSNNCEIEGNAMGHCGNTGADTILSLRSPDGEPHVSVAFDYDGTYRQAKGKQNRKPVEKYHPYMKWLFYNHGEYQIKKYIPEYQGRDDLVISDFDDEFVDKVLEEYPNIDPIHRIRKVFEDNSLSDEQKFDRLKEMDEEDETFGGELKEMSLNEYGRLVIKKDIDPIDFAKKDHHTFKWVMNVLRHKDTLHFSDVDGEFYIEFIDTDQYPYDSEQIQYLIKLAKDEDEDEYYEQVEAFLEYEDTDESLEEYLSDGTYLHDFIKHLYNSDHFYELEMALDRVAMWSMETQAFDDMYEDAVYYIKDTPLEDGMGTIDIEFVFEYSEEWHLVNEDGDPIDISVPLEALLQIVQDNPDDVSDGYFIDYLNPYAFETDMVQPRYGYPRQGIKKDTYNDHFADGIYN